MPARFAKRHFGQYWLDKDNPKVSLSLPILYLPWYPAASSLQVTGKSEMQLIWARKRTFATRADFVHSPKARASSFRVQHDKVESLDVEEHPWLVGYVCVCVCM